MQEITRVMPGQMLKVPLGMYLSLCVMTATQHPHALGNLALGGEVEFQDGPRWRYCPWLLSKACTGNANRFAPGDRESCY